VELRPLGSTGILVSPISLGTVKLGRDEQVKYPRDFRIPDDKEAKSLIDMAFELGINVLDTAPAYGNSESRIGALIEGQRKDWVIVTKAGEIFENGQSQFDFSVQGITASVIASLKYLRTDYLDVVLIHSDGDDDFILNHTGAAEALDRLKDKGDIRSHGMSSKTSEGGLQVVRDMDVVMATCNVSYQDELDVLVAAEQHNKGVIIKKALQSGHAAGDGGVEEAMQYIFSQPGVSTISIGTINPDHLRQNIEIVESVLSQ
jgi:aryl-alcohol dehydrogenase-like predicted oxidoreductase